MKYPFAVSIFFFLLVFSSCEDPVWTPQHEKEFYSNCVNQVSESLTYEDGQEYCNCALQYVKDNYPNPDEARNLKQEDQKVITETCLGDKETF